MTPNGDGAHDFLKIVNIDLYPANSVIIINRLGETVFKTENYDNNNPLRRFEGQANVGGGQNLADGTYFYIIDIGQKEKYTGFVHLQK